MYTVQEATSEYVPAILTLWTNLMNNHKKMDEAFFAETSENLSAYRNNLEFSLPSSLCKVFVAFVGNQLVGYITAEFVKPNSLLYNSIPYCEVGDIMIDPNFQKQGLGKVLVEEVKKWSVSKGIHNIRLNVFSKNKNALVFFKTLGFDELFHNLELKIN
ncbi:MAG: GNAT family N-acetyltransferase [Flavobacterium sp.]